MKRLNVLGFLLCAVLAAVTLSWAGPEETAIEKTIIDHQKAVNDFPRTRDEQSILRFYSEDYTGVTDGVSETLEGVKADLSGITEQLNLGSPIGLSLKVYNIKVTMLGAFGLATYDYNLKMGAGGEALGEEIGKCTDIYRKKGPSWVLFYEHCSSLRPEEPVDQGEQL